MIKRKRENSNYFTNIKSTTKVICKEKYIIKFYLLFKLKYIYSLTFNICEIQYIY